MKSVRIEWRHLESQEQVLRCSETGKTIYQLVGDITIEFRKEDIEVTFSETRLPEEKRDQANMMLFNGIAIEKINLDAGDPAPYCGACADPTDSDRYLKVIERGGESLPAIPGSVIRLAARKAAEYF